MKQKVYRSVIIGFLLILNISLSAQIPTTQDCLGAIPVCDFIYQEDHTATGRGAYNEIPSSQSCPNHCMDGEKNSRWYIFTVVSSGILRFEITPQTPSDDYDWSVFNISEHSCDEIWGNPGQMLESCNAAGGGGYQGATGISTPHGGTSSCNGGGPTSKWNADMVVWAGETYVLVVSDWTQTPGGYTLDFSASTAIIFDDQRPYVEYVGGDLISACGSDEIVIRFNENVKCSSIQTGDFVIAGPGGPYTITSVFGYNCDLGGSNEREYILTINPAIYQGGDFTLTTTVLSAISDACNNYAIAATVPFSVNLDTPEALAGEDIPIAYAGTATLQGSASGGSGQYAYYWEPSALLDDPTLQNPTTVALTTSTAFYLLVSDQVSACQGQDTMWVNVVGGPLGISVSSSSDAVCSGERVDLMANTGGGSGSYTFAWSSNPPGLNSDQPDPSVYPSVNTWYKVIVSDGFTQLSDSTFVEVHETPVADAGLDQVINQGTVTILMGTATGGTGNYVYQWEPANWLEQNNIPNPTTLPLMEPTLFTLLVVDANGCPSVPVQMWVIPSGDGLSAFPLAEPGEICIGDSALLNANTTGGGTIHNCLWISDPPGFSSTLASFYVSPDVTTRYDLKVTDEFLNVYSAHTKVTVNPLPQINLNPDNPGNDTLFACVRDSVVLDAGHGDDPINTEYYWLHSSYLNRYLIARTNGSWIDFQTHAVRVTNGTNGCVNSDSITIMFNFNECNISVPEHVADLGMAISIYPNPNSGDFTMVINETLSDLSVEVLDSRGVLVHSEFMSGRYLSGYEKKVELAGIAPGVYIVRFQNKQSVSSRRIIVK